MEVKREKMQIDILWVGAGPASLSGALHLLKLLKTGPRDDIQIAVIEKGARLGAHILSGAVLDPTALKELVPDFLEKNCPLEGPVIQETTVFLTEKNQIKFPVPPSMRNHGNYVCTLGKLVQWLGKQVEENGGFIFTGIAGWDLLEENGKIVGIITGDKGVDKEGQSKANFEPGMEIRAKAVVLGEGPLGTLTRKAVNRFHLQQGKSPQVYATSVKEIWKVPEGRLPTGTVIHTMGYPLNDELFGGGFVYGLKDNLVSIGLVVALDYKNPFFDTQAIFQDYKTHPFIRKILEGGKIERYGAKTIPEGGYFAIPKLTFPGGMIIGDSAGLVNVPKLKGIHYAMKSGMLAAEAIAEALTKNDFSEGTLSRYETKVHASFIRKDLYKTRHFKAAFHGSFKLGLLKFGLQTVLGGWWFTQRPGVPDSLGMNAAEHYLNEKDKLKEKKYDEKLTLKKITDVYYSGTKHEENQPVHLLVDHFRFGAADLCSARCAEEFGNPCQYFCPASVYEMEHDEKSGGLRLKINAANCVHCKTCDIKDPYGVIEWVPPEGGGGPAYLEM